MTIPRCDMDVRNVKVTFRSLVQDPDTYELVDGPTTKLDLGKHAFDVDTRDGSPILDTEQPFVGEMCRHEWSWLKGFPGKDYNYGWRFNVEFLKEDK